MSTHLYKVTLTDLGTYEITVAADSNTEAESIAKAVLAEEMTRPSDLRNVTREIVAKADPEPISTPETRQYQVESTYSIEFGMVVPASNRDEASRHAKRLYGQYCGPFEFEIGDESLAPFTAREVQS